MLKRLIIAGNVIAFVAIAIAALALKQAKTTRRPTVQRGDVMILKARRLEAEGKHQASLVAYEAVLQMPSAKHRAEAQRGHRRLKLFKHLRVPSIQLKVTPKLRTLLAELHEDGSTNRTLAELARLQIDASSKPPKETRTQLRALNAPAPWTDWLAARLAEAEGQNKVALSHLTHLLARDDGFWPAHHLKGKILRHQKKFSEAIQAYRSAYKAGRQIESLIELGQVLGRAGRREEALETLRDAAQRGGLKPIIVDSIGRLQGEAGLHRQAAATYRKAAEILGAPRYLLQAAQSHQASAQHREAKALLFTLLKQVANDSRHKTLREKAKVLLGELKP